MSKIPVNLVSRVRLRPSLKAVLKELAWFANDDGEHIFPSVATLAERTSFGRRAVQKILRELEQLGAIQGLGWRLGGRHRTTHYRLVLAWVQANCEVQKGERGDSERANDSAKKGERDSPEQNEHEIEKGKSTNPDKGKELRLTPYEEQRRKQEYRKAKRAKSFPTPRTRGQLEARRMEAFRQLSEFEKRRLQRNDE